MSDASALDADVVTRQDDRNVPGNHPLRLGVRAALKATWVTRAIVGDPG